MASWAMDREALLEGGFALLLAGLLGGLAVLIFGRIAGGVQRGQRRAQGPPAPGSVPTERHQNLGATSAR